MPLFGPPKVERLKEKQDVEALIKALGHKDYEVRDAAVHALGHLRDARAVDPLVALLGDESRFLRQDAAEALVKIGPAAVEPLIAVLLTESDDAREWAATALGDLDDTRAVEPLISLLQDEIESVRWGAADSLGKLGDVRAVDALVVALQGKEDDAYVQRRYAAKALGKLGDARAVGALGVALRDDEDDDVRKAAAAALGQIGDPLAVEPLIAALGDSSLFVRGEAEEGLANIGPAAVESLRAHLEDKDWGVAKEAAGALRRMLATAVPAELGEAIVAAEKRAEEKRAAMDQEAATVRVLHSGSSWFHAKHDARHTRQIVVTLDPAAEVPPCVENLVLGEPGFALAKWAVTLIFMGGLELEHRRGPFVFVKASGIDEALRGNPVEVAFAFYRMRAGGLFQIFVRADSPAVRKIAGKPFLAEHARWPGDDEHAEVVDAFISRADIELCFVEGGQGAPFPGLFGLAAELPSECGELLRNEWTELLEFHEGVQTPDYQAALDQYNHENPIEESPILTSGPPISSEVRPGDGGFDAALTGAGEDAPVGADVDRTEGGGIGAGEALEKLTKAHGELVEVTFIETYPSFKSFLVFKDGFRLSTKKVPGTGLIGGFTFGYSGTGPDAFRSFLLRAGFADAPVNSSSLPVPGTLRKDGSCVSGSAVDPRSAAARELGDVGDLWRLVAALDPDEEQDVRRGAVEALGELGGRAVEPLVAVVGTTPYALRALGKLGDAGVEALIDALTEERPNEDDDIPVPSQAAYELGELGDPRAIEPLITLLLDNEFEDRDSAAQALGNLGDPRAIEPLIAVLAEDDFPLPNYPREALGKISGTRPDEPLIATLAGQVSLLPPDVAEALGRLGDGRQVEPLIAALAHDNRVVRLLAAEALGKLGDPHAVEPMIGALADEDDAVQFFAAEALGELGDARAVEPLIAVLTDYMFFEVRANAANALGKLGDPRAIQPLTDALGEVDMRLREAAEGALTRLGASG